MPAIGCGQVITGAVLSFTVIVCVQLLELLQPSPIVYVLVITKLFGHAPGAVASEDVICRDAVAVQLSVAVPPAWIKAAMFAYGAGTSAAHWIPVIGAGQVITGAVLSLTLMVCVQVVELLHASPMVYVLVITKLFGHAPGAVASDDVICKDAVAVQLSVAIPPAAIKAAMLAYGSGT